MKDMTTYSNSIKAHEPDTNIKQPTINLEPNIITIGAMHCT